MRRVLVHGFTQTAASWDGILEGGAVDVVPGVDLWDTAARMAGEVAAPAAWIGYSMGARICLHVALGHPAAVGRLVVLGATPGIEDDAERATRRDTDEQLARRIESVGADVFLDEWLEQPMFEAVRANRGPRQRDARVLTACLRRLGTGQQEPLWSRLHELSVPVLVVAGARDTKYVAIGERMAAAIGSTARFASVPHAGHAAHLEQPLAFRQLVEEFLAS